MGEKLHFLYKVTKKASCISFKGPFFFIYTKKIFSIKNTLKFIEIHHSFI